MSTAEPDPVAPPSFAPLAAPLAAPPPDPAVAPGGGRAGALQIADGVDGWLTRAQAGRLWDAAASVRPGARIVEIGSFRGRSTVVLALAAPAAGEIAAIDPHAGNDRGPQEIHGFEDAAHEDHEVFHENLRAAGVDGRVRHVRRFSADAQAEVPGPVDVLFIDGAHRFGPARDDLRRWGANVVPGGRLLVHDAFSSVGVTAALLTTVAVDGRFEYLGRSGSLVEYRCTHVGALRRAAKVARHLAQLPWFARNVLVKVAIVAHLRPLARALGHDGETWPY